MMITRDYLLEQRKSIEARRLDAVALVNQTSGAIAMIDVLLKRLDEMEQPAPAKGDD